MCHLNIRHAVQDGLKLHIVAFKEHSSFRSQVTNLRSKLTTYDRNKNALCRHVHMCTKTDGHKTGSTPNPSGETIRTYPDQSQVWVGYRFREEDLILLDKLAHSALLCFLGWHERLSFPCTDSSAFLEWTRSPSSTWRHKLDGGF